MPPPPPQQLQSQAPSLAPAPAWASQRPQAPEPTSQTSSPEPAALASSQSVAPPATQHDSSPAPVPADAASPATNPASQPPPLDPAASAGRATPPPRKAKIIKARRPSAAPEIVDPVIASLLGNEEARARRATWHPSKPAARRQRLSSATALLSTAVEPIRAGRAAHRLDSHRLESHLKQALPAPRQRRAPAFKPTLTPGPMAPSLPKVSEPGEVMARTRLDTLHPSQMREGTTLPERASAHELLLPEPSPASHLPGSYQPPPLVQTPSPTPHAHNLGLRPPRPRSSQGAGSRRPGALPTDSASNAWPWNPQDATQTPLPRHAPTPAKARRSLAIPLKN